MSKLLKECPKIKEAHEKIMAYLATKDNQASQWGTQIVACKTLAEFILDNHDYHKIPREVQYFIALTWNFYAAIFIPEKIVGIMDEDFQNYFESGHLDDKFAMVVKQLYQICKEEKLL